MKGIIKSVLMSVSLFVVLLMAGMSLDVQANTERQWQFRVFLDDREIGYHRVRMTPEADGRRVSVEANFKVKVLFITAYRYEHQTEEFWKGSCLANIDSRTDDNGKELYIQSQPGASPFMVKTHDGAQELEGCIRSFAYWDPELLNASRLLNTQTGEYQEVEVLELGESPLEIDGELVEALQYRILVEDRSIDLWYTPDMNWLALQSVTDGGYRIRYLPAEGVL
jgi:hypothetical protein